MNTKYYDENGMLRVDLLDKEALEAASLFIKFFVAEKTGQKKLTNDSLSSAQLRRFYSEFKTLEKKFKFAVKKPDDLDIEFKKILPLVKMVKSKVEYSSGARKVPEDFAKWLKDNVNAINAPTDFEAFLLHFEAVVGFCYGLGMKES
jgi:CRISPR-associated protein Csm2